MVHKQHNEVKHSFNSANKYTDGRRCKRHREGLCSYTKRGYAGTGSVSTEKCGAANTERGYADIGLQTDAERDVQTLVIISTRTREYVCSSHLVGCKQTQRVSADTENDR